MDRLPVFAVADDKLRRVKRELDRLSDHLSKTVDPLDSWSRMATISFAVHGAYTGIEDIMSDLARTIDGSVPQGTMSHQALLEQMRASLPGKRPPLLGDELYAGLLELKGFRHLVRHHYGLDLIPSRVADNLELMNSVFADFAKALAELERVLSSPA